MRYEEDVDGLMIAIVAAIFLVVLTIAFLTDSMRGPCRCNEKRCDTCGKVVAE